MAMATGMVMITARVTVINNKISTLFTIKKRPVHFIESVF